MRQKISTQKLTCDKCVAGAKQAAIKRIKNVCRTELIVREFLAFSR